MQKVEITFRGKEYSVHCDFNPAVKDIICSSCCKKLEQFYIPLFEIERGTVKVFDAETMIQLSGQEDHFEGIVKAAEMKMRQECLVCGLCSDKELGI